MSEIDLPPPMPAMMPITAFLLSVSTVYGTSDIVVLFIPNVEYVVLSVIVFIMLTMFLSFTSHHGVTQPTLYKVKCK